LLSAGSENQAAQHRENLRKNSSGNYKSAALDQLSYAGKNAADINACCRCKQVADRLVGVVWKLERCALDKPL
jgi:hypothetical protein